MRVRVKVKQGNIDLNLFYKISKCYVDLFDHFCKYINWPKTGYIEILI